MFLEDGNVSVNDDRHRTRPWGILGGKPGACSQKWLVRNNGEREPLPAKIDHNAVKSGDRVIFRTAGAGGWGAPLEREPESVKSDVIRSLTSLEKAKDVYGVVLDHQSLEIDTKETDRARESMRRNRGALRLFTFGEQAEKTSAA